jgi:hypothetical protein
LTNELPVDDSLVNEHFDSLKRVSAKGLAISCRVADWYNGGLEGAGDEIR